MHYYIQCVKHRGPEGFQRNAALNRTCRVNGLCVHVCLCVCVGGVGVWWRDTRTDKYQQCNYTPDTLARSTCASLPHSLRCKPGPLIGPRGPCACVWGEVSIRVITPGPVQLTPPLLDLPQGSKASSISQHLLLLLDSLYFLLQ